MGTNCVFFNFIIIFIYYIRGVSRIIKGHSGPVRSISFSNDGAQLLSASDDKSCKVY